MSQKIRIVFRGEVIGDAPEATVRERAAQLLKASPEQVERIFSGEPVVLRKNLPEEEAPRYLKHLEEAGMRVYVEAEKGVEAAQTAAPPVSSPPPSAPPVAAMPLSERANPAISMPASMPDSLPVSAKRLAAPDAESVADHKTAGFRDYLLVFPNSRRIKRLPFWSTCGIWLAGLKLLSFIILYLGSFFTAKFINLIIAVALVPGFIWFVVFLRISILRCRDVGWPIWLVWFFAFLPFVVIFYLFLQLKPGAVSGLFFLIYLTPVLVVCGIFSLCLSLCPSKAEEMSAEMQPSEMTASTLPAPDTGRDADVADHKTAGFRDYLLGFPNSRRINRLTFWTACGLLFVANWVLGSIILGFNAVVTMAWKPDNFLLRIVMVAMPCIWFLFYAVFVRLSILRCRDVGWPTWLVWLFSAIPPAVLAFFMFLYTPLQNAWKYPPFNIVPGLMIWLLALPVIFFLLLSIWPGEEEE